MSKCVKCGGGFFKIQEQSPAGSTFKVYFVQCSSCDTPIGVLEYSNSGAMIEGLEHKINSLKQEIQQISYDISSIKNSIR
jgi:transcription initiation factor IIE alpha subunit